MEHAIYFNSSPIWPAYGILPAYILLIAFLGKYLGINAYTARAVGAATFLVSLVLIYLIVIALLKNHRNTRTAAFLACIFFALNPLAVRGSLLIEMEGSILNAALLLCIYVFCRTNYETMTARSYLLCGSVFALALWTKLTTPALFMASLLLYQLSRRKIINVFKLSIIGIIGTSLFFATWWLYSHFQHKIFSDIFFHSIHSFKTSGAYYAGECVSFSKKCVGPDGVVLAVIYSLVSGGGTGHLKRRCG